MESYRRQPSYLFFEKWLLGLTIMRKKKGDAILILISQTSNLAAYMSCLFVTSLNLHFQICALSGYSDVNI